MERNTAKDYHVYFQTPGSFFYEGDEGDEMVLAPTKTEKQPESPQTAEQKTAMATAIRFTTKELSKLLKEAQEKGYTIVMNMDGPAGEMRPIFNISVVKITHTEDL